MADRRKALGRGIDSLIPRKKQEEGEAPQPGAHLEPVQSPAPAPAPAHGAEPRFCTVEEIIPNRFQPRRMFDDESLEELTASIEEKGILEPLLVRPLPDDAKDKNKGAAYELIAGERRWRAAQRAQLTRVPITIRRMSDQEALEAALIENVMRDDLTPIEEAEGYQRLLDTTDMKQEDLAERIGKNRAHVANTLRLLKLPRNVRDDINDGTLTAGHGRALLAISDADQQAELYDAIVKNNLSVRQAEVYIKRDATRTRGDGTTVRRKDPHYESLSRELTRELGASVTVTPAKGRGGSRGGRVVISCSSPATLDKVIQRLRGEK